MINRIKCKAEIIVTSIVTSVEGEGEFSVEDKSTILLDVEQTLNSLGRILTKKGSVAIRVHLGDMIE